MKTKEENRNNKTLEWIFTHRGISTVVIIALFLIVSIVLFLFFKFRWKYLYPGYMYYAFQIIAAIFVVAGVIVAVWQYYVTLQNYKTKQAIDLTIYYKEHVLEKFIIIKQLYRENGIVDILHKVDSSRYKKFDNEEVEKLYTKEDMYTLKEISFARLFTRATAYAIEVDGSYRSLRDRDPRAVQNMLISYVTNFLNDLEYFAMNFTHNIADKNVIYQSIHQSYLEVVETMYFYIARLNYRKNLTINIIQMLRNYIWIGKTRAKRSNKY